MCRENECTSMVKKAVILFSGGIDSTVILAMAQQQRYECYPLSIRYNQRHQHEIKAATKLAADMTVAEHRIIRLDIGDWGGSSLTDHSLEVPVASLTNVPNTYVPARNTIFLSARTVLHGFDSLHYLS